MGVTISQLASGTVAGEMEYAGQAIRFTVRPDRITERTLGALASAASVGEGLGETSNVQQALDRLSAFTALNRELCGLIGSWNVEQDDGSPFPLDPERVAELPLMFRISLFAEATKAGRLGEANGTAPKRPSRAGSKRASATSSAK